MANLFQRKQFIILQITDNKFVFKILFYALFIIIYTGNEEISSNCIFFFSLGLQIS